MQFLLIGKASSSGKASPPEDLASLRAREQEKAQEFYTRGIFRQIWSIQDGAAVICEADTREQMERHVAALPMVEVGYLDTTLEELTPYKGFGSGFAVLRQS